MKLEEGSMSSLWGPRTIGLPRCRGRMALPPVDASFVQGLWSAQSRPRGLSGLKNLRVLRGDASPLVQNHPRELAGLARRLM